MNKRYLVENYGTIDCDDQITVNEFINILYDQYDMNTQVKDIITIAYYHPIHSHIVVNKNNTLADENIPEKLNIAYYLPDYFYYVEGGWGHHMEVFDINIPSSIMISLRFYHFNNTVVINSNCTIRQMINYLIQMNYLIGQQENIMIEEPDEFDIFVADTLSLKDDKVLDKTLNDLSVYQSAYWNIR